MKPDTPVRSIVSMIAGQIPLAFILLPLAFWANGQSGAATAGLFTVIWLAVLELSPLSPKQLFRRCAQDTNDHAAWQEFNRRYGKELDLGICRVLGFPPSLQFQKYFEDVKQNAYIRLLKNNRRVLLSLRGDSEGEARQYLRSVGVSEALNFVRRPRREINPTDGVLPENSMMDPQFGKIIDDLSLDKALGRELRGRNKYRNILAFRLHRMGCSAEEIAGIAGMNLTARAAENQNSRIRQKLKEFLQSN